MDNKKLVFKSGIDVPPPSMIIFYAIDKALERTESMKTQEFGIVGGHIFYHQSLAKEIDEYIERLVAKRLSDGN